VPASKTELGSRVDAGASHLPALASSIMAKLKENNRCLYLHSPDMATAMTLCLRSAGLDVAREANKGALILSSDQEHLENGKFDVDRMLDMLEASVQRALNDGYSGLWATGDMTWEFGPERRLGSLVAYECGLEDLFREYPALSGVCQYHIDTLECGENRFSGFCVFAYGSRWGPARRRESVDGVSIR
jgi:hypothetical protein